MGEFSGRELRKRKQKYRWKSIHYHNRVMKLKKKKDPLEGAPLAKGIVILKKAVEQKQPHSGLIKCVRVQLLKNGKEVVAFCPKTGAIDLINEHDEVLISGLGGSQGGPIGSMWGVRCKVVKVNNQALSKLLKSKGKKVPAATEAKK